MAARRCSAPPIIRSGSAARSSCRARARSISRAAARSARKLVEWPVGHTIKCLCFYHPDDPPELKAATGARAACASTTPRARIGRELLVEIIAGKHGPLKTDTVAGVLQRLYDLGIKPDWWKLEPQRTQPPGMPSAMSITRNDPYCRGIVLLGLEAPEDELEAAFAAAAKEPQVKGFAVGRTIFNDAARRWLKGEITDEAAIADMAAPLPAPRRCLAAGLGPLEGGLIPRAEPAEGPALFS